MTEILATSADPVRALSSVPLRWQDSLKNAVRSGRELVRRLDLVGQIDASDDASHQFPVFVTREYLSRIRIGDPSDPLLRQVFPLSDEMQPIVGFSDDPLQESGAIRSAGLIQKYNGRALMIATGACAIHCRYCFRRHFPYAEMPHSIAQWQPALDAIRADPSIEEILLSGGDPLMLTDSALSQLIEALAAIPHLRRLRLHSRLPIVLPSRITDVLVHRLKTNRLATWMVVHTNHASEIDNDVADALARLVDAGIPVLNQAVLLRGVNDNADVLTELCRRMINLRVTPYYLHQLDHVAGAAHFAVPQSTGEVLIAQLRSRLPGYAVPQLVVEQPGQQSKTIIA